MLKDLALFIRYMSQEKLQETDTMNWDAISASGEVIGALAVVITLGFLIFQLRQSTLSIRQQSARESTSSLQQISLTMMQPSVAGTINKVFDEADPELTGPEMAQLENYCLAYLLVFQQDYLDVQQGLQPHSLWESRLPIIESVLSSVWIRAWWHKIGHSYFGPGFRELIDGILSEDPSHDGDYFKRISNPPVS
jgi:hypothetical protein